MDLHYKREVTVGLFVIVAALILIGGLAWLSGRNIGPSKERLVAVRFRTVNGLSNGDPVLVSGVKVGRVTAIQLVRVGEVHVTLSVAHAVAPHIDAKATVRPLDAFGKMYVDYLPGHAQELLKPDQELQGQRAEGLIETASGIAGQASELMTTTQQRFLNQQMADDLHHTLLAVERTLNVVSDIGSGPTMKEATAAMKTFQEAAARVDTTLGSPDLRRAVNQLDEVTDNLNEMVSALAAATQSLAQIMQKMDSDKGTFGRLVNDTTLYSDMHNLTVSLRQLLDDMRARPTRYFQLRVF